MERPLFGFTSKAECGVIILNGFLVGLNRSEGSIGRLISRGLSGSISGIARSSLSGGLGRGLSSGLGGSIGGRKLEELHILVRQNIGRSIMSNGQSGAIILDDIVTLERILKKAKRSGDVIVIIVLKVALAAVVRS